MDASYTGEPARDAACRQSERQFSIHIPGAPVLEGSNRLHHG
jgi:hypothetical protein